MNVEWSDVDEMEVNESIVNVLKMEESSYVPNSIPPALVVFSQAGYGDAIRMQRPFSTQLQVSDGKDLSLPNLSPSSFGLRPMDSYGGLPAQLVHLQNPFLHPALEARLPFGSAGAFRPVVTSAASSTSTSSSGGDDRMSVKGLPSAFSTPNNRRKLESEIIEHSGGSNRSRSSGGGGGGSSQDDRNSFVTPSAISVGVINLDKSSPANSANYMNGGQSKHRSCSPASNNHPVNCSPREKQQQQQQRGGEDDRDDYHGDDRDGNGTPNSDMTDRSTPEDTHLSKRRRKVGEFTCPVCNMSVHPIELESHLLNEVEQLICISQIRRQQQLRNEPIACSSRDSPNSNKKDGAVELSQDSRWDTYQRVRNNRHSRLRMKTRRRREESGESGSAHPQVHFPVCRLPLHGSNEQLSGHLESCIRKNGEALDEDDEPVDIEGDGDGDSRDEYEWNGHRRVAKTSHNSHPLTAINMTTSRRRDEENDSLEVVVDGDDAAAYGYAQYTETDVQAALKSPPSSASTPSRDPDHSHGRDKCWQDEDSSNDAAKDELSGPVNESVNLRMVIQALRTRVRELEKEINSGIHNDGNHCLVCMDKYRKPVVSISCWHVHCERCWLRSLGTKKLCPQCNMITSVSDLRRIFL